MSQVSTLDKPARGIRIRWPAALLPGIIFLLSLPQAEAQKTGSELIDSLRGALASAKEDTGKVNALNGLSANAGWRLGNYDTARYYAREAQVLAERIGYKKGIAAAYNNFGRLLNDQGDNTEALKNFFAALGIFEEIGNRQGISFAYHNIGMVYSDQGNYPEALKHYRASLEIKEEIGERKGAGNSYSSIGVAHYLMGNYPEALDHYFAALKIYEAIDFKSGISNIYHNIGLVYQQQGDYPEALKNFFASLKIEEEMGSRKGIASTHSGIGDVYLAQGNFDEALKQYSTSLKIAEEVGEKQGIASAYQNIGDVHRRQGHYPEALANFLSSLKIEEEIGNNQGIAAACARIGNVYVATQRAAEGQAWLERALAMSLSLGTKETIKEGYAGLAKADSALGDYRSAFAHYKLFMVYRDSLLNEENTRKSVQAQMQYDFDKREDASKAAADAELRKQKLLRNGFLGGFAVVFAFALVFFRQRNITNKEKRRAELEQQRSEDLLLNILPAEVAEELKTTGAARAKAFTLATVMLADFKDFTKVSERVSAEMLVEEIHQCFSAFDALLEKYNIEKIKTIGDAYLCAGGLPVSNYTHAVDMLGFAREILEIMAARRAEKLARGEVPFEIRIGIHSGPVVAGIVGTRKYAYDIWGDTVNIAARMEQNSEAGKINISGATYALVKDRFPCTYRGKIPAKNKGEIDMYFVENSVAG